MSPRKPQSSPAAFILGLAAAVEHLKLGEGQRWFKIIPFQFCVDLLAPQPALTAQPLLRCCPSSSFHHKGDCPSAGKPHAGHITHLGAAPVPLLTPCKSQLEQSKWWGKTLY